MCVLFDSNSINSSPSQGIPLPCGERRADHKGHFWLHMGSCTQEVILSEAVAAAVIRMWICMLVPMWCVTYIYG